MYTPSEVPTHLVSPSSTFSGRLVRSARVLAMLSAVTFYTTTSRAEPTAASALPEPTTAWRSEVSFGVGALLVGVGLVAALLVPFIADESTNHGMGLHMHSSEERVPLEVGLLAGGVLFMGGGVTLMIFGAGEESEPTTSVAVGPGSFHLRALF